MTRDLFKRHYDAFESDDLNGASHLAPRGCNPVKKGSVLFYDAYVRAGLPCYSFGTVGNIGGRVMYVLKDTAGQIIHL